MSQTSERAEQIWSGWSKFGVGGTNLEWVEQIRSGWSECGQNSVESSCQLEKTLLCKFLFSWAKFLKLDTCICWFSCEI